jgi:hypothetical protein
VVTLPGAAAAPVESPTSLANARDVRRDDFEVIDPVVPNAQSSMRVAIPSGEEWLDLQLKPALYCRLQPLTVKYA